MAKRKKKHLLEDLHEMNVRHTLAIRNMYDARTEVEMLRTRRLEIIGENERLADENRELRSELIKLKGSTKKVSADSSSVTKDGIWMVEEVLKGTLVRLRRMKAELDESARKETAKDEGCPAC